MSRQRKIAVLCALLIVLHGVVFLAGFFAPCDPETQHRDRPFAPPTHLHFFDAQGRFHLRPFVVQREDASGAAAGPREIQGRSYPLRFFVRGAPYKVAGVLRARVRLFGADEPAKVFLMGTDAYGRDLFSRVLYGGQISLLAGLLATALSLGLGLLLGGIAGFYGGWSDELLMRGAELFMALPWLYLLFAVRAFLPLHVNSTQAFLLLVLVIGMVGWARPARMIRGVALAARERDFVRAARMFGASDFYLLRRHVLPQAFGVVMTQASVLVPQFILAEVTLSFLGLGVSEPTPSWGNVLAGLQQYFVLASYWWMFLPALVLAVFLLGYFALASALHEGSRWVSL